MDCQQIGYRHLTIFNVVVLLCHKLVEQLVTVTVFFRKPDRSLALKHDLHGKPSIYFRINCHINQYCHSIVFDGLSYFKV